MKKADWFLAGVLATVVVAVAWHFSYPCLHPSVWTPLAEAAGLRTPAEVAPGLWRALFTGLFALLGVSKGLAVVPCLGFGILAALTICAYRIGFQLLKILVPENGRHERRRTTVWRISSALATLAFVTAEPVWRGCQACQPDAFNLLLLVLSVDFVLQFCLTQRAFIFFTGMLLVGVTVSQTIWGVAIVVLAIFLFARIEMSVLGVSTSLNTRTRLNVLKWKLSFVWLVGLLGAIAIGIWAYAQGGGFAVSGSEMTGFIVHGARVYLGGLTYAADMLGWVGGLVLVAFPCGLLITLLPKAANEDVFLTYRAGFCYFTGALAAYAQLSVLSPLWIWSWTNRPLITSDLLQMIVCALSALTLLASFAVVGIYASCRSHVGQSIIVLDEMLATDDYDNEIENRHQNVKLMRRRYRRMLVVVFAAAVLLLAGLAGDRAASRVRFELRTISAYVERVLADAQGCRYLFTDGKFDDLLRLVCAARGIDLHPFSFMDGRTPREIKLLTDYVEGAESQFAAKMGAPTLLRTWTRNKASELAQSGVQIGFELWHQDLKRMPPCWGTMLRTSGDEAKRAESVRSAKALAESILDEQKALRTPFILDRAVNEAYQCVLWRISRVARARSDSLEGMGQVSEAQAERVFSDRLDKANIGVDRVLAAIQEMERAKMRTLAPREALHLALVRADFPSARFYAEKIVLSSPRNAEANYAMAMSCVVQRRFKEAEKYFRICLDLNPKDPALLNNLAMCLLADGRLAEARETAEKARSFAPDAKAIRNTLREIAEAEAVRATNGVPPEVRVPTFTVGGSESAQPGGK